MAKRVDHSRIHLPEGTVCAVMVGSVGQPRDADDRAAWVIWDTDARIVEFKRTDYPRLGSGPPDPGSPATGKLRVAPA